MPAIFGIMYTINYMKPVVLLTVIFTLFSCSGKPDLKPNIVLIVADDIGISDIGCYGGEILTPNIDRLAREGLRFTTFYNMAKCDPTRSSMLTGLYTGGGNGAVHIAHLTGKAGYFNIMSGKEHFNAWVPDYCRAENVFDHSFISGPRLNISFPRPEHLNALFISKGRKSVQRKSSMIDLPCIKLILLLTMH